MIQIVFMDIDGTLIPYGQTQVSQEDAAAVADLQKQGILVFAVTGRCASQVPDLDFDGAISYDGACIQDKGKTILQGDFFKDRELETIVAQARQEGHRIVMPGNTQDPVSRVLDLGDNRQLKIRRPEFLEDDTSAGELTAALAQSCFDKGMVTAQILKVLHIPPEASLAMGDGFNDMGMLAGAGISVAMKNAPAQVQACADYTADGVVEALHSAGLLKPPVLEIHTPQPTVAVRQDPDAEVNAKG